MTSQYPASLWFNPDDEHQDDLARLMTLEQGKPLAEAKAK